MDFMERDLAVSAVGYESLVWIRDDSGRDFSCSLDTGRSGVRNLGDLTEHKRISCLDVSLTLGTERR